MDTRPAGSTGKATPVTPTAAQWKRFWSAVGSGVDREGRTDIAERHDEVLAEIYAAKIDSKKR